MKVSEDIDVQMLNEFKQGRLEMLYRRLYPALLLYAVRYAGEQNSFLAEDCVQNAVFNAWKRRLQFESVESLKSFLYISIKNEIVSLHRKAKASERYLSQLEEDVFFQNSVIDQETQLLLYYAIRSLPERERQIFELSFIEGLKITDIAEQLNVSESTVKKTKAKALDILREKLPRELFLFFFVLKSWFLFCQLKFSCRYLSEYVLLTIYFCSIDNFF